MPDPREDLVRKMIAEGTSDDDILATLTVFDAQQPVKAAAPSQPPSALRRFAGGVGQNLNPVTMVQGAYQAVRHPVDTYGALVNASAEQFGKSREAFGQGRISEGLGHGAAGLLPGLGPAAAKAGERIGQGDVAGGVGEGVGLLAPSALAAGVPSVGRLVKAAGKKSYRATLKPLRSVQEANPTKDLAEIGLKNNLPLRGSTLGRINTEVKGLEGTINTKLAGNTTPIDLQAAVDAAQARLTGSGGPFRDLAPDRAKVAQTIEDLAANHPDFTQTPSAAQITAQLRAGTPAAQIRPSALRTATPPEAQGLKQRLYGRVRDASWGELAAPQQETLKSVAHQVNSQLKTAVPEIAPDLAQQSDLLAFQDALGKALPRLGNNNLIPLESAIYLAANPTAKGAALALSRLKDVGDIGGRGLYRGGAALEGLNQTAIANLMRAALVAKLSGEQ